MHVVLRTRQCLVVLAALLVGLTACGSPEAESPREGVSTRSLTGDLSGNFDADKVRVGTRQTLRATVDEVLSPGSFTMASKDVAADPLLAVSGNQQLTVGQVVQVVGLIRVFSYDELAAEYALTDPQAYAGRDGDLVLVAETVDTDIPGKAP